MTNEEIARFLRTPKRISRAIPTRVIPKSRDGSARASTFGTVPTSRLNWLICPNSVRIWMCHYKTMGRTTNAQNDIFSVGKR